MVLVIALKLAGVRIQGDRRTGVQIVSGMQVARPRSRVADAPIGKVPPRIVVSGDPDGAPPGRPRVAFPAAAAGLLRPWNGVKPPRLLAGLGVVGGNEGADAKLAA